MTILFFACFSSLLLLLVSCQQYLEDGAEMNFLKPKNEQATASRTTPEPLFKRIGQRSATLSSNCETDSTEYLMHVFNMVTTQDSSNVPPWVVQLMDNSGKPPNGVLQGNFKWLGSFSQCLKVEAKNANDSVVRFTGQYCTANVKYEGRNDSTALLKALGISGGALENLNINLGICWPSSCTTQEISDQIDSILHSNQLITKVNVTIPPDSCIANNETEYDSAAILALVVFYIFAFLMSAGTAYDLRKSSVAEPGILLKILLAFSVYTNGKKILTAEHTPGTFTCIHGLRFLSITWVILGHSYLNLLLEGPMRNVATLKDAVKDVAFDIVLNSTFSVDTFFVISGFLLTYLFLKEMRETDGKFGLKRLFQFYFHRYWRLTPAFMATVLFIAGLFSHVATGPMWKQDTEAEISNCQKYWWRNMLYIHNLFDIREMCHDVSWYLGIDMQFYAVSLLIIYPLYKMKMLGLAIMNIFFLVTTVAPALIIHLNDLPSILYANLGNTLGVDVEKQIDYMDMVYVKPWCRMGPYLAGMFLGFVIDRTNLKEQQRTSTIVIGWSLATICGLGLIFGNYHSYTGDLVMTNALNTVYGAFSRSTWGMVVAWIIYACVTGYGGFVNTLLSWNVFIPLSRLTYCAYLVHLYILIAFYSSQKATLHFSHHFVMLVFFGTLTITMAVAFVFSLAFEAPMIELEKLFRPKVVGRSTVDLQFERSARDRMPTEDYSSGNSTEMP